MVIQKLEIVRSKSDPGQLAMMNALLEIFTAMEKTDEGINTANKIVADAFRIMVELDHTARTEAFDWFIRGMREGLK
jgi:hypothetical protein